MFLQLILLMNRQNKLKRNREYDDSDSDGDIVLKRRKSSSKYDLDEKIYISDNHIYFYDKINIKNINKLIKLIKTYQ